MGRDEYSIRRVISEHSIPILDSYQTVSLGTDNKQILAVISNMMNQYIEHLNEYMNKDTITPKKKEVTERSAGWMIAVKKEFDKSFGSDKYKTKKDLYQFIMAFPIPLFYFNQQLLQTVLLFIRKELSDDICSKYELDLANYDYVEKVSHSYNIFDGLTIRTGDINIDINSLVESLEETVLNKDDNFKRMLEKLNIALLFSKVIENYYAEDKPFSRDVTALVERVMFIVSKEYPGFEEKANKLSVSELKELRLLLGFSLKKYINQEEKKEDSVKTKRQP